MLTTLRSHKTKSGNKPVLGIRARLMLLALLAVEPLMLERVHSLEAGRAERIEMAASEAMELARRSAEEQNEIVITVRALLQAVARAYVSTATAVTANGCASFLDSFAQDVRWIKSLSVINAAGRIVCSTEAAAVGTDLSDRTYFREAVKSGEFVLSDFLVSRVRGEPAIIGAYPTETKGSGRLVMIAPINLEWIARATNTTGPRAGTAVNLVDSKGTLLARHPALPTGAGLQLTGHPLIEAMLAHNNGSITTPDIDGTRRIFGYVAVPWGDSHLAVGLDEAEVLSRIDWQINIAYAQLAFFGLLTLLAAWLVGERLVVAPIRTLASRAARMGRGEFDAPQDGVSWIAEFNSLASAMDDMAKRLAERERELTAANRHLTQLATSDGLSGLANRRGFDARLQAEWQIAAEFKRPVALLMIDVDHFKLFNDRYGHVEGDTGLRAVGEVLAAAAGTEANFAARYGGEEFALLLPGANLEKALEIAERLRRQVEELRIANAGAPCGLVTVSIGVASFMPIKQGDSEKLVEAADIGLYAAKRRGRNAVVAHGPLELSEAC
jgi:diguanylate cyclase (GGDEF)-like protein